MVGFVKNGLASIRASLFVQRRYRVDTRDRSRVDGRSRVATLGRRVPRSRWAVGIVALEDAN